MNQREVMDLRKVCRLCLRIPKQPVSIFENELLEKIAIISSIHIESVPEFSDQICQNCVKLLNISYKFRQMIINSNNDLYTSLKILKKNNNLAKQRTEYPNTSCLLTETIDSQPKIETTEYPVRKYNTTITPKNTCPNTKTEMYKCELCNEIFDTSKALWQHKKDDQHYINRHVLCKICGISILFCNLKKHVLAKHAKEPSRCEECGKLCIHANALRIHKKEHHSVKEYTCQICGQSYSLMCRLKVHLKSHNKEICKRKYCCSICGKVVNSLKKHMLIHTGEKPYVCTQCNKGLSSRYALKIHIRTHSKIGATDNDKP